MDNTRISDFRTCPRYYWIRHVKHWVPQYASLALINGSCWHEAMNAIWAHAKDTNVPDMALLRMGYQAYCDYWIKSGLKDPDKMSVDEIEAIAPRGPQVAKEVMWNYILQRRKFIAEGEVIDIERPFAIPLIYDDDGRVTVYYVGRLDKVFKHPQHGLILPEHKTTSWYAIKGFFRQEWIDSFSPNSQVDGYLFAGQVLYGKVNGVWIDGALFHKKVFNGIKWLPIDRMFSMIDQWLIETYYWIGRIKDDTEKFEETGTLAGTFPKNTGSCGNYGGCTYRDVCRFVVDPSRLAEPPAGFKIEAWNPFDVLKLEKLELEPEDAVQPSWLFGGEDQPWELTDYEYGRSGTGTRAEGGQAGERVPGLSSDSPGGLPADGLHHPAV
jgi:hypothetical protein